jgi:NAD+ synthase/NAD+ synthase (glutamine-hydrolysing)
MKIGLLQINPTVGDLGGNARLIAEALREAGSRGADLAITPELALVGYLPRDLLLDPAFVARSWDALARLARDMADLPPVLVGLPEPNSSDEGRPLFNSAVLLHRGELQQRFRKALLPTYDVFDEDRYFEPFHGPQVLELGGRRLGISICEDVWNDRDFWKRRRYHHDPIVELVRAGADAIVNLSASPFTAGKHAKREAMLGSMAQKHRVPVAYVNQYGGNDDLVLRRSQLRVRHQRRTGGARPLVRQRRRHLRSGPCGGARSAGRSRRRVGDLAGARARHARLRAQMRLHQRRHWPVGRN